MEESQTEATRIDNVRKEDEDVKVIAVVEGEGNERTEAREGERTDRKGMEILQKLPPGTIVIKQEKYKEDSDYVRDSTETSSGGSSSTSGCGKVRRIHRAVRKNRATIEIRRNPMRVTKKDPDKDFPRPRQRLLSAKRKEGLFNTESVKRTKTTMPYMNTRSVTRKMYNVGATYQPPTIRDETEWKEWPVHGMHERPIFHPQVGLAAEYLGRCFTSLDGVSYREIVDPEIEVVSVDPHCEFLPSSGEKKRSKKSRSQVAGAKRGPQQPETTKSFQSCMHESLHCVLGYCSQVMTPTYKANVEAKIGKLTRDAKPSEFDGETQANSSRIDAPDSKEATPGKAPDNYTVTTSQVYNPPGKPRLFSTPKMYVANPQKSITFANLKTLQGGQMKLQEVVRATKSPLILVNSTEAKTIRARALKPVASDTGVAKMENAGDETQEASSSTYKNLVPSDEPTETSKASRRTSNKVEFTMTKYRLDNAQQNKVQGAKESGDRESYDTQNKETNVQTVPSTSKTWCSNDTSEIAKILSEYNKKTLKKPNVENPPFCATAKNVRIKEIFNTDENGRQNIQDGSLERNVNIKFPQGKWRRFHLTVEKLKDLKMTNEKNLAVKTKQLSFKDNQNTANISNSFQKGNETSKHTEPFVRPHSSKVSPEKTEKSSMSVDEKTQSLQELLENTAMLYCAATGTHQDDLADYIESLDSKQSLQWLETCENSVT